MNWQLLGGVVLGVLILRVVGFIPSTWLALGFVALVWFWNYLLTHFQTQKRLINWGLGLMLVLGIAGTTGWNIYTHYFQPYTTRSRAAGERARLEADLETAMRINPQMLRSRLALNSQLQYLQDNIGDRHATDLQAIQQQLAGGQLTPEEAWGATLDILKQEKEYRAKSQEAISQLSEPPTPGNGRSLAWKLGLIGLFLLGISLIPRVQIPGKKFAGGIGMAFLIIGLILWVFPAIPEKIGEIAEATTISSPPPATPQTQEQVITLPLHPDRWTKREVLGAWKFCKVDGPPGTLIRFDNGTTGSIEKDYPHRRPNEGFAFKGPEGGTVTLRITNK